MHDRSGLIPAALFEQTLSAARRGITGARDMHQCLRWRSGRREEVFESLLDFFRIKPRPLRRAGTARIFQEIEEPHSLPVAMHEVRKRGSAVPDAARIATVARQNFLHTLTRFSVIHSLRLRCERMRIGEPIQELPLIAAMLWLQHSKVTNGDSGANAICVSFHVFRFCFVRLHAVPLGREIYFGAALLRSVTVRAGIVGVTLPSRYWPFTVMCRGAQT